MNTNKIFQDFINKKGNLYIPPNSIRNLFSDGFTQEEIDTLINSQELYDYLQTFLPNLEKIEEYEEKIEKLIGKDKKFSENVQRYFRSSIFLLYSNKLYSNQKFRRPMMKNPSTREMKEYLSQDAVERMRAVNIEEAIIEQLISGTPTYYNYDRIKDGVQHSHFYIINYKHKHIFEYRFYLFLKDRFKEQYRNYWATYIDYMAITHEYFFDQLFQKKLEWSYDNKANLENKLNHYKKTCIKQLTEIIKKRATGIV